MNRLSLQSNRGTWLAALALLAFLFAQSVALLHQASHAAGGPDRPTLPGPHSSLCTDCVSHAPLLVMAGTAAVALFLALQSTGGLLPSALRTPFTRPFRRAFRSRAPPR
jgi:hypothetical protein